MAHLCLNVFTASKGSNNYILVYVMAFRNQNFMVTWFININLKEGMFFFFFSSEKKIITRYRRIWYNLNFIRQSVWLVFNPIMVDNNAAFFNCTPVGRASDSMMAST